MNPLKNCCLSFHKGWESGHKKLSFVWMAGAILVFLTPLTGKGAETIAKPIAKPTANPIVAVDTINGSLPDQIRTNLTQHNISIRELKKPITPEQFNGVAALLVCGGFRGETQQPEEGVKVHALYANSEVSAIAKYVTTGGTLIGAGQTWTWVYKPYGNKPCEDHPLNQLGTALRFKVEGDSGGDAQFKSSEILKDVGAVKLDNGPLFSIVDVGRNSREVLIHSPSGKAVYGAGTTRGKGKIYIFGHQVTLIEGPQIASNIVYLSYAYNGLPTVKNQVAPANPPPSPIPNINPNDDSVKVPEPEKATVLEHTQLPLEDFNQNFPMFNSWVNSPLDAQIPTEFSEYITELKERILDDGQKLDETKRVPHIKANDICTQLLNFFNKKRLEQTKANLRVAQATARSPLSNQALDARRNHLMSWPQYERENRQREVLMVYRDDNAKVSGREMEVKWQESASIQYAKLVKLHSQFRDELRKRMK